MNYRPSLLAGAALAAALVASPAFAQNAKVIDGLYFSAGAGANWLQDATTTRNGISSNTRFKTGPAAVGALGWGLGNGFRFEGELGYRSSEVNNGNGSIGAWTFMGN